MIKEIKKQAKQLSKNLISHLDPKSPAAEAYRSLRTNIHYTGIDKKVKSIVLTSPGPAEGKSTTCANIAISMSQAGKKVLILEGDLRKPKVHKYFAIHNTTGITDVIVDNISVDDVIKKVEEIDNLMLLLEGLCHLILQKF